MKFVISDLAEADFESISDYVAQESPAAANRIIADLLAHCASIGANPMAYSVAQSIGGLLLRRKVMGRYLIFYVTHDKHVEIVRVLHGARNIDQAFGD